MGDAQLVIRLAVGLTFACSVVDKIRHPKRFAQGVIDYRVLPPRISYALALALIPAEGAFAVSHLGGIALAVAVPSCIVVLTGFGAGVAAQLARGNRPPCFCFDTAGEELISGRTAWRLLMLLSAEAFLFATQAGLVNVGSQTAAVTAGQWSMAFAWANVALTASRWLIGVADIAMVMRGGLAPRPAPWHVIGGI